jgi:twitching motility protein PilT
MAQIDILFKKMLDAGASDLHLEQGQVPKMRLHGEIVNISKVVLDENSLRDMLIEITPQKLWQKYTKIGDLDFAYEMVKEARFRVNYFRHFDGFGAVFRIIPTEILTLEKLKTPAVFKSFGKLRAGLVLVTGPTGSGKSTTLAAILDYINKNFAKKVITIEEPVEFIHKSKQCVIKHREVGDDTKSFASGLRGALKSDVDIILVGEMRDQETIELALTAVEMGILVFGTLHTSSAAKTIDRIIDVFPPKQKSQIRTILANALKGVVAQQLLRTADGKGRCAAHEILLSCSGLPGIIRSGESVKLNSLIQMNTKTGMQTMDECLFTLVSEGRITSMEAQPKAIDKNRFEVAGDL